MPSDRAIVTAEKSKDLVEKKSYLLKGKGFFKKS